MNGQGQTAPTGVSNRRVGSPCHIPLQGRGTQPALLLELAGPEGGMHADVHAPPTAAM